MPKPILLSRTEPPCDLLACGLVGREVVGVLSNQEREGGDPVVRHGIGSVSRELQMTDTVEMIRQLEEAGWKQINGTVWKSPDHGYYHGPAAAWKQLQWEKKVIDNLKNT